MDKDEENRWQCPVLCKPFSNYTKIVAVIQNTRNEANVYSWEAYHELNVKTKNYVDLVSGLKFNKSKDVIILQDPDPASSLALSRDINNFKHIRTLRNEKASENDHSNIRLSVTASRIMDKVNKRKRDEEQKSKDKGIESEIANDSKKKSKIYTNELIIPVSKTSGKVSGSFTSTSQSIHYTNEIREATDEEIKQSLFQVMRQSRKKGYVQLNMNIGVIILELDCDICPRTCTNFIGLVELGKYNGCTFHRSIRNFMIQGGKPTDPNEKETSFWGDKDGFPDEFDERLKHNGQGVLSMANAGANTNKRQFFITYKSAPHLDRKHSVFGRVVKGIDVLQKMQEVPTGKDDRPKQDIKILNATALSNPVEEAKTKEDIRIQKLRGKNVKGSAKLNTAMELSSKTSQLERDHIGKYLPKSMVNQKRDEKSNQSRPPPPSQQNRKTTYGDFSGW